MTAKKEIPTSMKERLGDKYDAWYKRHRVVENQRIWNKELEENPIRLVPEYEREMPEETYSLAQAFYHPIGCECGSCIDALGRLIKVAHVNYFKSEPWVRAASSPIPELPDRILRHLQAVEEEVRSRPDLLQQSPKS